jgi:exopolysaccharide production protein ExoQ
MMIKQTSLSQHFLPWLCLVLYGAAVTIGSFTGGFWAYIGLGGGLLLFLSHCVIQRQIPKLNLKVSLFILSFLGIIAVVNSHAEYQNISWPLLLQEATILIPLGLLFTADLPARIHSDRFFKVLHILIIISALALGSELALGGPLLHRVKGADAAISEYNRGISYLVMLAIPVAAYLWNKKNIPQIFLFIAILLYPVIFTESRATKMAFVGSIIAIIVAYFLPVIMRWFLTLLSCALFLLPFGVTDIFLRHPNWVEHLPESWKYRVEIWDYMSYRIFDRPLWGWGFGSSYKLPFQAPHANLYHYVTATVGHPHDAFIQLWVELGIAGVLAGLLCFLFVLNKSYTLPRAIAPFAMGAWVAALCISLVAYNFWDDSLSSCFALTALAFMLLKHETTTG